MQLRQVVALLVHVKQCTSHELFAAAMHNPEESTKLSTQIAQVFTVAQMSQLLVHNIHDF